MDRVSYMKRKIMMLEGSVINGTQNNMYCSLSTVAEPSSVNTQKNHICISQIMLKNGLKLIMRKRIDIL
jgi:hypothetical protein